MLVSAKKVDNDTIADLETRVEDRNCSPPLVIDGGTSEKVPSSDGRNPQVRRFSGCCSAALQNYNVLAKK